MKRILILFIAMFMLCSCSSGKVSEDGDIQLEMLTRSSSGNPRYNSFTDDGYYEVMDRVSVGGRNIMYTDFATGKQIYLCNRPECYHNDESCPRYFSGNYTSVRPFIDKSGTKLLCYVTYMDEEYNSIFQLLSMNLDGSERKLVCELGVDVVNIGHVVASDDKIYNMVSQPNFIKREVEQKLISIDLSTGEKKELYTFDNREQIMSAHGSKIYLIDYGGDADTVIEALDLSTGEKKEVYSYTPYRTENMVSALGAIGYENFIYVVNAEKDTYEKINLDTGESRTLTTSFSKHINTQNSIYQVDVLDGHIFVQNASKMDANGNFDDHWYAIDMQTGDIIEQDIEYYQFKERRVAYPIARFKDSMLIAYDLENVTVTIYGPGNTPYEVESPVYKYGIISKSDFYNNIKNIQPVESAA